MISDSFSTVLKAIVLVTVIKILLIPSYHSTDFEVHRNWLAITHTLPISQWYYEHTSEWTLDYPPFFAWFEYLLSQFASFFDKEMLRIDNLNYASMNTILFQRLSVEVTDLVLIVSILYFFHISPKAESSSLTLLAFVLCIFAPGFLIVDHIHFQYNGYLIGLLTLSLSLLSNNHPLLAAFLFSFTMNSKHLFCFQAPIFLIYLLSTYCVRNNSLQLSHFFSLASIVLSTFFLSLFPVLRGNLLPNLTQFLSRLFPFQRGLIHSYWAPNVWALYAALDRVCAFFVKQGCSRAGVFCGLSVLESNTADGKVEIASFSVLPSVSSMTTMALLLLCYIPVLARLWKLPTKTQMIRCTAITTLLYFLLGYHVHEKAILPTIILAGLLIPNSVQDAKIFMLLTVSGTLGLFPLLFTPRDIITETLLFFSYVMAAWYLLDRCYSGELKREMSVLDCCVLAEMGIAWCCAYLVLPWILPQYPFLPLMLISVACAVGNCYVLILMVCQLRKEKSE
ncbi:hypothetical protein WA577_005952 [Blastocystis sp. JDR]